MDPYRNMPSTPATRGGQVAWSHYRKVLRKTDWSYHATLSLFRKDGTGRVVLCRESDGATVVFDFDPADVETYRAKLLALA